MRPSSLLLVLALAVPATAAERPCDLLITGGKVVEDAVFGYRAAAPARACNQSYYEKRAVYWDPVAMKVVGTGK